MDRSDLIKHTLAWVTGKCVEWNMQAKQFSDMSSNEFQSFVLRTHNIVYRYLRGMQTLDGKCSDFECTIAIESKGLFGDLFKETNEYDAAGSHYG